MLRSRQGTVLTVLFALAMLKSHAGTDAVVQFSPFLKAGLVVNAEVNGKRGTFLFDTGAGVTNVTPQFARMIGCKPWGQISGFSMMGQRLDMQRCDNVELHIDQFERRMQTVGVFDGNQMMPPGAPKLDGSIGLDAFANQAIALSYSSKTLRVLDSHDVPKSGGMPLRLFRDAGGLALCVNLPIETAHGTAWFELDSGNVTPMTAVAKPYAEALSLDANAKGTQNVELALPDGSSFSAAARLIDLTLDGNLGVSFLSKYDVTLDLPHARVWVSPVKEKP